MYSAAFVFFSVLIICYLILIPLEYRSLKAVKETYKESDMSQQATQSAEEQLPQANKEGSILNVPAVAIASLIYKARHREA